MALVYMSITLYTFIVLPFPVLANFSHTLYVPGSSTVSPHADAVLPATIMLIPFSVVTLDNAYPIPFIAELAHEETNNTNALCVSVKVPLDLK